MAEGKLMKQSQRTTQWK